MARYVYTSESGTTFKVNTSDKCDTLESENEVRQVLDDLGDLLDHTKFDNSYPKDASAGGTLGNVKKCNYSSTGNPTTGDDSLDGYAVGSRWINTSADEEYVCADSSSGAAVWIQTAAEGASTFVGLTDTPASYSSGASKILTVTTGETAIEFTSSTGIKLDDLGTPDNNTDLDATTGQHGLLLKRTGSTVTYLRADGTWDTPTGTTGGSAMTFLNLTDTPADYSSDANKILNVNSSSGAVEFTSATGFALDGFGTPSTGTSLDATTGRHGLLPILSGSSGEFLDGDGNFATPPGAVTTFVGLTDTPADFTDDADKLLRVNSSSDSVEFVSSTGLALDSFGTPSTGMALDATTGVHGLLPILSGSSGEYLDGDGNFAVPPASDIEVSEIGTATYDDAQDWIDNTQSGGKISGFTITDDSSGGIAISSGTGFIQSTTGDIGLTKSFDLAADSIVSTGLTDNSANYIYMDYNAGTPQILATATRTDINLGDQFTIGRLYKNGTDIHIIGNGVNVYNATRRNHERLVAVRGFERASGGVVSESAVTERALTSTIGNFYLGGNKIITTAQNTSTGGSDYFTTHYYINSAWASSTGQTQIDNTQYNNTASTGLETLTNNRYGVHWAYIHYDSDIQIVFGQGNYTLAQAENAVVPDSLPSAVEDFGILASKIIIQKSSTGFNSIVTAYKTLFPVSNPAEHNDLGGLDVDDYQHLTATEHTEVTPWLSSVTLSTGGTINIPDGQEYQIDGKAFPIFHETFMDVRAANSSGIHAAITGSTGSEQTITTNITNPDIPRNASIILTQNSSPTGDITLYGTFADGTTGNEAITSTTGVGAIYGNKAFAKVSQFIIPITVSSGDTVSVGWSDKIGLCNTVSTGSSVFKLKKNAADTSTGISGNVDVTYNTLNLATITDYDDYEIWYKS